MNTELSPELLKQLDALRDIDLPAPVSWWPLAPGWWGLLALLICSLAGLVVYLKWRQRQVSAVALRELDLLRSKASKANAIEMATEISVLLRRIAMRTSGQQSGTLNGAGWVEFLTRGEKGMEPELAEFLAEAPYTAEVSNTAPNAPRLLDGAELWIRRHA